MIRLLREVAATGLWPVDAGSFARRRQRGRPTGPWLQLCLLLGCAATAFAQTPATDTLIMTNGERRAVRIVGLDARNFSVEVQITPGGPTGTVSIARGTVAQVEFAPDPARDALLAKATAAQTATLAALWQKQEPFLAIPRSYAARIGLRYSDLLLEAGEAQAKTALALFARIEKEAWSPDDKTAAKQGRLRGMVAAGQIDEAVAEANEVVKSGASPEAITEAKFILANASEKTLRKLLEDNPRWEEDDRVRPERARLLNDTLDAYLYPSLFAGSISEPAARGLWSAVGIYQLIGETKLATESAQDIVVLHPGTRFAKLAQDFLATKKTSTSPAKPTP